MCILLCRAVLRGWGTLKYICIGKPFLLRGNPAWVRVEAFCPFSVSYKMGVMIILVAGGRDSSFKPIVLTIRFWLKQTLAFSGEC